MKRFSLRWAKGIDRNLLIVAGVAVGFRLLWLGVPNLWTADSYGYEEMAWWLLQGNMPAFLDTYLFRTPSYPALLASVHLLFGSGLGPVLLAQHFMGVLVAVFVYLIGRRIFDPTVALVAGLLVGVNSAQMYWEHNIMADAFLVFLIIFVDLLLLKAVTARSAKWYVVAGVVAGITILGKPVVQLLYVLVPVLIYLFTRRWRDTLRFSLYFAVPAVVLVTPWVAQNYLRHNYLGISPSMGWNIMHRTAQYIDFSSELYAQEKAIYLDTMRQWHQSAGWVVVPAWGNIRQRLGYSEVEIDKVLTDMALESIRQQPVRYVAETIPEIKRILFAESKPQLWNDRDLPEAYTTVVNAKRNAGDFLVGLQTWLVWELAPRMPILVPLALVGIAIALVRRNVFAAWLLVVITYLTVTTTLVEFGIPRYQVPIVPYMALFAAYGAISILRAAWGLVHRDSRVLTPRQWVSALGLVAVALILSLGINEASTRYISGIKGQRVEITARYLGQDGHDYMSTHWEKPSGIEDLHLRIEGAPEVVEFIRISQWWGGWAAPSDGIHYLGKFVQDGDTIDVYFEPVFNSQEDMEVKAYFIDGSYGETVVRLQELVLPIEGSFFGQDGADYVSAHREEPSGVQDIHIRLTNLSKAIRQVRIEQGDSMWVGPPDGLHYIAAWAQDSKVADVYYEPLPNARGDIKVTVTFADGSSGETMVRDEIHLETSAASGSPSPSTSPKESGTPEAIPAGQSIVFRDDFNRAPTPLGLGTDWAVGAGRWSTDGSRAYESGGGTTRAYAYVNGTALPADGIIREDFTPSGASVHSGILFRASEITIKGGEVGENLWYVSVSPGRQDNIRLHRMVEGYETVQARASASIEAGNTYRLTVRLEGPSIQILLDGVEQFTISDPFNQTATWHGLFSYGDTASRHDNWTFLKEEQ